MTLRVVTAGPGTLVQDLGRPGLAHLGVSPSGAADPLLLRRANALAGNRRAAAGLEVVLGATFEALRPTLVAVTGGGDVETAWVERGERITVEATGLFAYVAIPGGVDAVPVLGSRSRDTLAGLGPVPLRDGDVVGHGDDVGPPGTPPEVPPLANTVGLLPSPWDGPDLRGTQWTVSPDSSRVAVRLEGPPVVADRTVMPEGVVRGAVQVPPSGRPIVFGADHPVTGGYPIAGVVHPDDLRSVLQARPGTSITLTSG